MMTITKITIMGIAILLLLGVHLLSSQMMGAKAVVEEEPKNTGSGHMSHLLSHQFNNVSGTSVGFSLNLTNVTHYRITFNLSTEAAGFDLDGEWMNGSGKTDWIPCESIDHIMYVVTGGDDHPETSYADFFIVEVMT